MKKLTAEICALALGNPFWSPHRSSRSQAQSIRMTRSARPSVTRTQGAVGAGLAMTMLVTGGTIGVARNSPLSTSHGDARQLPKPPHRLFTTTTLLEMRNERTQARHASDAPASFRTAFLIRGFTREKVRQCKHRMRSDSTAGRSSRQRCVLAICLVQQLERFSPRFFCTFLLQERCGRPSGTRTPNQWIKSPLLYQLS